VNVLFQDIQTFLDEAPQGVIYFSLGTMIRSDTFPSDILQAFIDVFTKLPFRVLWKSNPENMPALPDNILLQTWMPQRDILGNHSFVHATCNVPLNFSIRQLT